MTLRRAWLLAACLLYLLLATHQLGLPGLHYDEAREAGVNAMELLTAAPVTAFRGAALLVGDRAFPLMVQDYIGALNVYLALPVLGVTGIGVPNLRAVPVLTGLLALLALERAIAAWLAYRRSGFAVDSSAEPATPALTVAGLVAVTLLAVSPSFVFWARQGIFVTNLMLPLTFAAAWQAIRWLHTGRMHHLLAAALAPGLAFYAKLLAVWALAPLAALAGGWWLWRRRRGGAPALPLAGVLGALALFVFSLAPLILFNVQTGGTLAAFGANAQQSYYGVNNADLAANLPVRWGQVLQVLRGEQFWYLGAVLANPLAPWCALLLLAAGLLRDWRLLLAPLLLFGGLRLWLFPQLPETHALFGDWAAHASYGAMFAFGVLLARRRALLDALSALRWPALALGLAGWLVLVIVPAWLPGWPAVPELWRAPVRLAFAAAQWGGVAAALGFARRHLNRDHRWRAALTEAVYPLYLVHQTIIVGAAVALRPLALPAGLEALLIVGLTFGGGFAAWLLARRSGRLRPWLGLGSPARAGLPPDSAGLAPLNPARR